MRDAFTLTNSELKELSRRATSRTARAKDARRARLILLLAKGHTWDDVSERIDCSRGFVASWSRRFTEQRIAGLYSRHLGQVATVLTPKLEARILEATRHAPPGAVTHWSTRKLGAHLEVSHMMVHRVWREAGLKPHRLERYMASDDPDFEKSRRCDRTVSESTAARGCVLRGRKDSDSSAGSFGPGAAAVSGPRRAPRVRILPAWHAVAVRGTRHQDRARTWKNDGAPHQRRLRGFPRRGRFAMPAEARDPHYSRQSVGAQNASRAGFSGHASEGAAALHADVFFVAESSRAVVRQNRARRHQRQSNLVISGVLFHS